MVQIPIFVNDAEPHAGGTPSASPGALAAPGEQLARAADQISEPLARFQEKYAAATRDADATNAMAGATRDLGDMQHRWSLTPNRQQALDGFNGEAADYRKKLLAGVKDPLVGAIVSREFDSEAAMRALDTGKTAFELESSTRVGDLEKNLASYSQAIAAASSDAIAAKAHDNAMGAIHTAAAAGWIAPAKAAELELSFGSQTAEVGARQIYERALASNNPAAAQAAVRALNDPSQFPGLLPDARERWLTKADSLSYRLENRAIAAQAHADAVAERNLHRAQENNEATVFKFQLTGHDVDDTTLGSLLDGHQITAAGATAILNLRDRVHEGSDDAATQVRLWHDVDTGHAQPQDIYAAIHAGTLKGSTGAQMIRAIDEKSPGSNASERGAYGVLRTAMNGQKIEQGAFGDSSPAVAAWAQAQGEWHQRVTIAHEDPTGVLNDLMKKYAHATTPTWLAPPRFGAVRSFADIQNNARQVKAALDAHQIDQAAAEAQRRLLNQYLLYYPSGPTKPQQHGAHP